MPEKLPSFDPLKEKLHDLYGIDFPDSLFFFHEFLRTYPRDEFDAALDAAGIGPTGLLQVLDRITEGKSISTEKPILLHYRFYRDLPEFFTCLHGDTDGLHWGLLWDEPRLGFRGAASYYTKDGDGMIVYEGLFDAVRRRIEGAICCTYDDIEDDPANEDDYRREVGLMERMKDRLIDFVDRYGISESRPSGVPSDTGLDLLVSKEYLVHGPNEALKSAKHWQSLKSEDVNELLLECERGHVIPTMLAGRSLWFSGFIEYSAVAYKLLRAGYAKLERPELIRVLDLHFQNRDMRSVDLLSR